MAKKTKNTNVSSADLIKLLNQESGDEVAFSLKDENPTEVKYWISTGSRWLDSITCKGQMGGIPGGKISSIAGLSGTGKSYLATQISANAIKQGMMVVYFDSEVAIDPEFLEAAGIDLEKFVYIVPKDVEHVLETMETILAQTDQRMLFVWDSLAFTESRKGLEMEIDPQKSVALIPRILSTGFKRLMGPLARKECTFLVLNQLKTRISSSPADRYDIMAEPYFTPGGLTPKYSYSMEIWLTNRKSKSALKVNDSDFIVGAEVKAKIKKSRFGSQHRECVFDIEWGDQVRICDEESWFEAIQSSERFQRQGAWYTIDLTGNGDWSPKFRASNWVEKLQEEDFGKAVLEIMDNELINKFIDKTGDKDAYYDIESKLASENQEEADNIVPLKEDVV